MVGSVRLGPVMGVPLGLQPLEESKCDNKNNSSSSSSSSRSSISNRPPRMPPQPLRPVSYQQVMQNMTVYERNICKNITSFWDKHSDYYLSFRKTPEQARAVFAAYAEHVATQYEYVMDARIEKLGRNAGIDPKERIKYVMECYEAEHKFFASSGYSKEEVKEILLLKLEKKYNEWQQKDFPVFERYEEPEQVEDDGNEDDINDNKGSNISLSDDSGSTFSILSSPQNSSSSHNRRLSSYSSVVDNSSYQLENKSDIDISVRSHKYNHIEEDKSHKKIIKHKRLPDEYRDEYKYEIKDKNNDEGKNEDLTSYDEIGFDILSNLKKINIINNDIEGDMPTVLEEFCFESVPEGPLLTSYEELDFHDAEEKEHQPLKPGKGDVGLETFSENSFGEIV